MTGILKSFAIHHLLLSIFNIMSYILKQKCIYGAPKSKLMDKNTNCQLININQNQSNQSNPVKINVSTSTPAYKLS